MKVDIMHRYYGMSEDATTMAKALNRIFKNKIEYYCLKLNNNIFI